MTLVVDASVAAKWFIEEAGRAQAIRLLDVTDRQAPDLLLVEVANVVWKKALRGEVSETQAGFICASIAHCFDVLHSSDSLIERAIVVAIDLQHPVYDCLYLACAERAGARLATADRRLIAAVKGSAFAALVLDVDDFA
ncbi:MAG: type II toxin-antitoxin system VapC family toxin [Geminicoccaceae bacterium]